MKDTDVLGGGLLGKTKIKTRWLENIRVPTESRFTSLR